jgi:hypothetical protein
MSMAIANKVTNPSPVIGDVDCFSIPEFCRRHGICRGSFYNMKKNGTAPRTMKVLGRVMISKESALQWRQEVES